MHAEDAVHSVATGHHGDPGGRRMSLRAAFDSDLTLHTLAIALLIGIGETSKVFIIVYTTVFVVILNTAVGVKNISPDKINAARSLGANRWQLFMLVIVPATVPFILTGMRLAMANSFTTVVSAEMVAASHGLGYLIWSSRVYFETDAIFVSMAMLGLLGFLADRVFRIMTTRFARRFHTHSD